MWALLVFLPFFKLKLFIKKIFFLLFVIGSIEFGLISIFDQIIIKILGRSLSNVVDADNSNLHVPNRRLFP